MDDAIRGFMHLLAEHPADEQGVWAQRLVTANTTQAHTPVTSQEFCSTFHGSAGGADGAATVDLQQLRSIKVSFLTTSYGSPLPPPLAAAIAAAAALAVEAARQPI